MYDQINIYKVIEYLYKKGELRHLEKAVDFQVHIHKLKSLQYEAKARTTPDIYDPELVHLREELAMAWSEYRIAQKMLNDYEKNITE